MRREHEVGVSADGTRRNEEKKAWTTVQLTLNSFLIPGLVCNRQHLVGAIAVRSSLFVGPRRVRCC